jgi:hypothetical protein
MIRISQQNPSRAKLAERVLGWVSFARRPLLIDELRHGLAVENDTSEMDVENLPSIKTILSVCIGLVVVDHQNDTVRLIHLTAREFFLKRGSKALLERTWEDMSRACLTYLSFKPLQSGPCNNSLALQTRMQALPFLEYAAQYWGEHVSHAESGIQKELMTFLNKSILMSSALEVLNSYPRRNTASSDAAFGITPESLTILHVAAYWDLQTTTRLILKEETGKAMIPVPDCSGWTPFHWAASNGHVGTVKLLIDHQANLEILDNNGWTPLFWAVSKGHMEVVKILLESGANVSHCDWLRMTPLDLAENKGSEMIELLLSYDSPTGDLNKYRVAHSPRRFWYAQS